MVFVSSFNWLRLVGAIGFASAVVARANDPASSCLAVTSEGQSVGQTKDINGIQTYISSAADNQTENAVLYITDIYGVPLAQNRLLADSIARANYLVVMPDLFRGDPVPLSSAEGAFNFATWSPKHPASDVDSIISSTIKYMRNELGVKRIGAVGYCFGGKYVPRFLAQGKGVDVGFIAHPSGLENSEIQGIVGPISIAAADLDQAFNSGLRRTAEDILFQKKVKYQINLYSGAPHGFAVRANLSDPSQKYAKESAFFQAVRWFDNWL